jgi:hypothetical protein
MARLAAALMGWGGEGRGAQERGDGATDAAGSAGGADAAGSGRDVRAAAAASHQRGPCHLHPPRQIRVVPFVPRLQRRCPLPPAAAQAGPPPARVSGPVRSGPPSPGCLACLLLRSQGGRAPRRQAAAPAAVPAAAPSAPTAAAPTPAAAARAHCAPDVRRFRVEQATISLTARHQAARATRLHRMHHVAPELRHVRLGPVLPAPQNQGRAAPGPCASRVVYLP